MKKDVDFPHTESLTEEKSKIFTSISGFHMSNCPNMLFFERNSILRSDLLKSGVQKGKNREFELRKINFLTSHFPDFDQVFGQILIRFLARF